MKREEIIDILQSLAKNWFSSSQQNAIQSEIFKNKGLIKLANKFKEEATEEFEEAQKCIKRIIELGGLPKMSFEELTIYSNIEEYFKALYKEGETGVKELSEIASKITDDFITKQLIQEFIVDENEHIEWVKSSLNIIELIGIENYLIEQL